MSDDHPACIDASLRVKFYPIDMGRLKLFNRVEVLEKAIPLFWEKGLSETSVQDLGDATGVNKSGLYSEFTNKEDLFLASLKHYLQKRGGTDVLSKQPLGWANNQAATAAHDQYATIHQMRHVSHNRLF